MREKTQEQISKNAKLESSRLSLEQKLTQQSDIWIDLMSEAELKKLYMETFNYSEEDPEVKAWNFRAEDIKEYIQKYIKGLTDDELETELELLTAQNITRKSEIEATTKKAEELTKKAIETSKKYITTMPDEMFWETFGPKENKSRKDIEADFISSAEEAFYAANDEDLQEMLDEVVKTLEEIFAQNSKAQKQPFSPVSNEIEHNFAPIMPVRIIKEQALIMGGIDSHIKELIAGNISSIIIQHKDTGSNLKNILDDIKGELIEIKAGLSAELSAEDDIIISR